MTENTDYDLYAQASAELDKGDVARGVWAKAYSETSDQEATKRLYIKYRVAHLKDSTALVNQAITKASAELNDGPINAYTWNRAQGSSSDPEAVKRKYLLDRTAFWSKALVVRASASASDSESSPKKGTSEQATSTNNQIIEPAQESNAKQSEKITHAEHLSADTLAGHFPDKQYMYVFIATIVITISLFLLTVSQNSNNHLGSFFGVIIAWWMYKHKYKELIVVQKVMILIASITCLFALTSSDADLRFSDYDSISLFFGSVISVGVHFWLLRFFQKRLGLTPTRMSDKNL